MYDSESKFPWSPPRRVDYTRLYPTFSLATSRIQMYVIRSVLSSVTPITIFVDLTYIGKFFEMPYLVWDIEANTFPGSDHNNNF